MDSKATKINILKGIENAFADFKIVALTKKNEKVMYDYVNAINEIQLNYQPTILPLKKFFFPKDEVLLDYTNFGKINARIEAKPTVLFGARPCDLNAIKILNEVFADDHGDPNYLAKKEQSVVIGIDCKEICDKHAFCFKVGTEDAKGGFDIMLYELCDNYLIKTANKKGEAFVEKYFITEDASESEFAEFKNLKLTGFKNEKKFTNLENFPEIFDKNRNHPIWDQEGARCLSCGSCIMVCPTCYCFDVKDEMEMNMHKGCRTRNWDACMLSAFATVATGENFRHNATARLHHRINRKFNYLMKKHKMAVCVGCGRCVRACLVDISPKTIAAAITEKK